MANLHTLPNEVLDDILEWLDPADLVQMPFVSRALYRALKRNTAMYRAVYLHHFDTPEELKFDWVEELQNIAKLERICDIPRPSDKEDELPFVFGAVCRLLKNASYPAGGEDDESGTRQFSRNVRYLAQLFSQDSNCQAFLQRSSLFERLHHGHNFRLPMDEIPSMTQQRSAKLHCLYGMPIIRLGHSRWMKTVPWALSKVYDVRRYRAERRDWGIFTNYGAGLVNWEMIEAIMVALYPVACRRRLAGPAFNMAGGAFAGSWPDSQRPHPLDFVPPNSGDDGAFYRFADRDPYGVTGTWHRLICRLNNDDFDMLMAKNASMLEEDPYDPFFAKQVSMYFSMKLVVSRIESPGPTDGQELPIVHFLGAVEPLDNATALRGARIRGTVGLSSEGEVRWTMATATFDATGAPTRLWQCEGIQIGGVKAARSVIGSWFEAQGREPPPVGADAFWKVNDVTHETLADEMIITTTAEDGDSVQSDSDSELDSEFGSDSESVSESDTEDDAEPVHYPGAIPIPIPNPTPTFFHF